MISTESHCIGIEFHLLLAGAPDLGAQWAGGWQARI